MACPSLVGYYVSLGPGGYSNRDSRFWRQFIVDTPPSDWPSAVMDTLGKQEQTNLSVM